MGDRTIGEGKSPFVIAELGYNFRTLDEALRSVEAAAGAGADALKIQTFRAETTVAKGFDFPPEAGGSNQFDEFKRYEISEDAHRVIFDHCRRFGLIPFSTPSHADDVDLLERLEVPLYKVGSDDLTNLPLLEYAARKRKPLILSTGMATLEEVEEAVQTCRSAGNSDLVVLQCVSNYPIRNPEWVNLRVIETYRKKLGVLVGFSDHTLTFTAAVGAVALGAVVIERHFVLDKSLPVPDGFFSADPGDLAQLVRAVREVKAMLGNGEKEPSLGEFQMRSYTRKSAVARTAIRKGEQIRPGHVIVKRPGTGVLPREASRLVGRTARQDIEADRPITWDMVNP